MGVRTQARKLGKLPVLAYLYAEPKAWPYPGAAIPNEARTLHAEEVRWFARMVGGAEVQFQHFTYGELMESFATSPLQDVHNHAGRLLQRFDIA